MSSFGERLRKERERAGLTQNELANRAGVSIRTITRLEASEEAMGQAGTIERIEQALGAPLTIETMVQALPDATDIILSCRAIIKNKDKIDKADLRAIRSSLEWALDTLRGDDTVGPGERVEKNDID